MTSLAILTLVVCAVICLFASVPAYTGIIIINRLTGNLRSIGPGTKLLLPWEKIVSEVSLKKTSDTLESDFETRDKATVSLKVSFDVIPVEKNLMNYEGFEPKNRLDGIKERIRSIMSAKISSTYKDREEVMSQMNKLATETKKEFEASLSERGEKIEEYYGANLASLVIADVALPQALKDAATEMEAQKKRNETLISKTKAINEARKEEMETIQEIARKLVAESGGTMMFEDAVRRAQVQFDKVKDENKTFGLDKGTQRTTENAIGAVKEILMAKITTKEASHGESK